MAVFIKLFRNLRRADQTVSELLAQGCPWPDLNLIIPQAATETLWDPNLEPMGVEVYDQVSGDLLPALTRLVHCQRPVVSAVLGCVFVVGRAASQLLAAEETPSGGRTGLQELLLANGLPAYLTERYVDAMQQGELLLWTAQQPG